MDLSVHLKAISKKKVGDIVYILCEARKTWVVLTPEEIVRQSCLYELLSTGYSINHISVEKGIRINGVFQRYDIVLHDKNGVPLIIVECKAPQYPLKQKVMDQAGRYNIYLNAPYVWISNGHNNLFYQIDYKNQSAIKIDSLPLPSDFGNPS